MKQTTLFENGASAFDSALRAQMREGWRAVQIAVNPNTNIWFAILERD